MQIRIRRSNLYGIPYIILLGGFSMLNELKGTIDGIKACAGEIADATSDANAQNRNMPQMVAGAEREAASEAYVLLAKVMRALTAASKVLSAKPPAFPKLSEKTAATTETHKSITEKVPKWM